MSASATKTVKKSTYYGRSHANADLGKFLIFFGIVGATPFYAMFANIVLKQADIEWRIGIWLGVLCIIAGYCFIKYSRRRFRVKSNPDGSGTISIKEGLFKHSLAYRYSPGSKIQLSLTNLDTIPGKGLSQITLIDGNHYYLLDSRDMSNMDESRLIAEFLVKSGGLNLLLPHFDNLEVEPADLDLTFLTRIKKHPVLMDTSPEPPAASHITITPLNNGHDRCYAWGFLANGLLWQFISLVALTMLLSLLPVVEIEGQLYSLFGWVTATEHTEVFYVAGGVFLILLLILSGFRASVTIEGFRINTLLAFWGIPIRRRSLLVDNVWEIFTKEGSTASYVVLTDTDDNTIKLRIANSIMANYLRSEMRQFLANR